MTVVCMDTNALMMPVECDLRVFEATEQVVADPEYVVPDSVCRELRNLAGGASREAVAATVGSDLAERCRTVETEHAHADDAIVALARAGECEYVVTNDGPLRERLLDASVPVIGLRGRNELAVTQP
ncbi:RNA-binding protein [Halalkalicoccus jeotgali]|uniref:Predicted RNA-binding protein containing PIN domain protein n=1 Tax=Halalkalicoccus jeotgali (strain DSM 18796 / CECT 7217 / JCM 14584 / KCTC 4019 / B3) TaxID=795797 RepID=D8J860_HALJB|nr:RNA-binding protein [Halalkalicoccus jeotgali]ADJ14173.1 Predicted RNA-binding protein containing PIN domain protein [Halalkalicoccus jeotgali B3]ELY34645.1 putative RNA-binding protein containing PIN domain-containing protein [Halalkalicoccus jeotgali B3]